MLWESKEITKSFALAIGGSISRTVTLWTLEEEFPLISVTLYVTNVVPIGNCKGASFDEFNIPQSSLIRIDPKLTLVAKQEPTSELTVMLSLWIFIVGSVVSLNVTNWVAVTVFPNVSLAVHVIVVVPDGKELGASFEKVNEQLSLTVGIPRIITQEFDVMFGGGMILGEILSSTVTRWKETEVLLAKSETLQVTVVVPIGYIFGALLDTLPTVQLSEVVGFPKTTPVASHEFISVVTTTSAGGEISGAIVSDTVTNWVAETVFPEESVTDQITGVNPIGNVNGALFVGETTPQLSVADATPIVIEQFAEIISAGIVKVGLSTSKTVIVCVTVVVLLALSVTVQVRMFIPLLKVNEGLSLSTIIIVQLSEVVGVPTSDCERTTSHDPGSVSTDILMGGVTVGGVISLGTTEIFCVNPTIFPSVKVVEIVTEKFLITLLGE